MGEKGLVGATGAAADASSGVITSTTETVVGTFGDAAGSLKDKVIDKGLDHVIEEGRERLHGSEETGPE